MTPSTRLALPILISLATCGQAAQAQPPQIGSFAPAEGPAGQAIVLEGKGFTGTKRVLFTVGHTFKDARFKVVNDAELRVDAPEYYREAGEAAITVVTPAGVTVTVPENAVKISKISKILRNQHGSFWIVEPGGVLDAFSGVVFIEPGGVVSALSQGAVHYARKGGNVGQAYNCLVYHEKGVTIGEKVRKSGVELIEVPAVTRSTVPALFKYTKPDQPEPKPDAKRVPPLVKDIVPSQGWAGHIVSLRGQGFTGTTGVLFKIGGAHKPAGFRVVSDGELRVEVPESFSGRGEACPLVVVTEAGATLVTDAKRTGVEVVRKGVVHKSGGGGATVFIEPGGVVPDAGGGSVLYLVKNGATLGRIMGGGCVIYHEPKVLLGDNAKGSTKRTEVPILNLSSVKTPFRYVARPR